MSLLPHSGNSTSTSTLTNPEGSQSINDSVEAIVEKPTLQDFFNQQQKQNQLLKENTHSETFEQETLNAINIYTSGIPIKVTYYENAVSQASDLAHNTEILPSQNPREFNLTRINDFAFRLSNEMDFSYDPTNNINTIEGEGVTIPGHIPNLGDLFTYPLSDGSYGIFKIVDQRRLSIDSNTCYLIQFKIIDKLSYKWRDFLDNATRKVLWFSYESFLNGDKAYFTSEEINLLNRLANIKDEIYDYLKYEFYVSDKGTYIDEVYDPYVIEFLNSLTSIRTHGRAKQLLTDFKDYPNNVYACLSGKTHKKPHQIAGQCEHRYIATYQHAVGITSLINKPIVHLVSTSGKDTVPYIFSDKFYKETFTADPLDPFESFIHLCVTDPVGISQTSVHAISNMLFNWDEHLKNKTHKLAFCTMCLFIIKTIQQLHSASNHL